ncbi:MAG: 3-deoxy-D-manno-octulosonic acid transferase [Flavobacteriaceae bacterium]|nr:3-deoxy-D-manno-octulosonic acid transferase [Flavobacteriaceae bacterium]
MNILYDLLINIIQLHLHVLKYFNKTVFNFLIKRKKIFKKLKSNISKNEKYIWIHVASLGEYEQGLPVFKKIKSLYKDHKIVLSFFSSSGYDLRKNNPISDLTVYLPIDTSYNAKRFIDLINPEIAVFVKYEFWPNFLKYLKKNNTPTYLLAGVFRKNHWFFKPYGFWMRNNLKTFNHFFVQNNDSKNILKKYNFNNCSVMGDSRFERVLELPNQKNEIKYLNKFKKSKQCFVAGSTWNEDDEIIIKFINSYKENDICFIIAPHQIDLNKINKAKSFIKKKSILMSELNKDNASKNSVIFIDSIGLLTSVYSYADIGYVGGGMGNTGLHNTLEPAVFKIPVIVGKNFEKFHEVSELINLKGFISIKNYDTFKNELIDLINNKKARDKMGQINYKYILNKIGASEKVITYLKQKK